MLWSTLAVLIPILGLVCYFEWQNKQADEYNEWLDQQEYLEDSTEKN
jgi:hypothetical protein